jgi:high-affinity iron transporter
METVIGLFAVAMVTYMVVWMARHAQGLKQELERSAADALVTGTAGALVAMAFLAVLREGLETVVFLIATFNASTSATAAAGGAILGILVAIAVGYGIYRGGVRLNLARFFRVTGAILVLIAAGLLATAAHTAHEAGWIDVGQTPVLDLSWLVRPGTPWSSLFTGMLGIQPRPVVLEVLLWVFYLVPMSAFVLWPRHRRSPHASAATAGATQ